MAKTKGPAFSASASGTIGDALTYQKNKAGKYVRGYNKPGGPPSINQETIRQYTKEAVALWKWLTDDEKELWNNYVLKKAIEDNLIALWPMNEGSGVVLPGHSRYRTQGNILGATWVDGKWGGALNFNGIDNSVSVPHSPNLNLGTGSFTISAWIKSDFNDTHHQMIVIKILGMIQGPQFSTYAGTGNLRFFLSDGAAPYGEVVSTFSVTDGEWHFCVGVRDTDEGKVKIYIDGDFDNEGVDESNDISNTGELDIGRSNTTGLKFPFTGIIDEVAMYNRVLTPTEIKQRAERKTPGVAFPTGTIPVKTPSPEAYSGYHCFIAQFTKNRMQGIAPLRLPTGVYF